MRQRSSCGAGLAVARVWPLAVGEAPMARPTHGPESRSPPDAVVGLTTRVPRRLALRVRLFCVEQDRTVESFVAEALREFLAARTRRQPGRRR